MITANALTLRRGIKVLFQDASFTLNRGERVGITGRNGTGKSSLFELILGRIQSDQGDLHLPPGLAIAHVAQETPALATSALDYVLDGDPELRQVEAELIEAERMEDGLRVSHLHERLAVIQGYDARARAAKLLNGLGFAAEEMSRSVSSFSGGWRVRLNVAQALMCRSDLLLLDEPTNHLDLDAVIWLQDWLSSYPGTLLLVSHDRDFLDDLSTQILNIEHGRITLSSGNYSAFEVRRSELLSQLQAAHARQQRDIQKIQGFVDRFRAKATKAKQVQSRIKALERMQIISLAQADSNLEFAFSPPEKAPSPLIKLEEASAGYGQKHILAGVSLSVQPGDRIGLLGPNGAGKSTLVKLLSGVIKPATGIRLEAQDLRIGYFAQHQLEQLRPDESPLWHMKQLDPKATEKELRGFLGGFSFQGDRALEPIAPLSGGEKSRLVLALLIYQRPNLLLLDEPTNHLDLETRDALTLALQDYEGALILVSHDRFLLRTVADDFFIIADGSVSPFDGDLDDYRGWLSARRAKVHGTSQGLPSAPANRKQQRQDEAERRRRQKSLANQIEKAEAAMQRALDARQGIEDQLAASALYEDSGRQALDRLLGERARIEAEIETAESRWLEASEAMEALSMEEGEL